VTTNIISTVSNIGDQLISSIQPISRGHFTNDVKSS